MLRQVHRVLISAVLVAGSCVVLVAPAAEAAPPGCTIVSEDPLIYDCETPGEPGDPGGPGGPGGPPKCNLDLDLVEFCEGTAACWINDPAGIQDEDRAGPRPSPEAHIIYKRCHDRAGAIAYDDYYWSTEPSGPTPGQRAQAALGQLQIPLFTPRFNPPTRTLVNLDTWWWAEGGLAEVQGTPALGVRAVAFDGRMEVDPGDGSEPVTCPLATTRSDACTYVYPKASRPGYTASMRLVYSLRFELVGGGDLPAPPGVPLDFGSRPVEVTVPVREIQSVVTPND